MKLDIYQVDAFSDTVFGGNPAAVVPLASWLDDALMQAISMENNLSETAFFVRQEDGYDLRWFTPVREVELCGHATLATAHVIFDVLGHAKRSVAFHTRSGKLTVERHGKLLRMDFPASPPQRCETPELLAQALGIRPLEVWAAGDYIAVLEDEETVRELLPDHTLLSRLDRRGVIVTAPGKAHDFVSRFFAPKYGIQEDPVTGSAHCSLAPYWAGRLGKHSLNARQVSKRGGNIHCEVKGGRVLLSGQAVLFLHGEIFLQEAS
jgi:PhzF family phenazine biosynthesis protein